MLGETVGNYRIEAKIAEGGMGAVYRAAHNLLDKAAAVKVLRPELSSSREVVQRFFTEARAATSVRHPGIVEIYDFGHLSSGVAYIVMELLAGESLAARLAATRLLDEGTALLYLRGMASALAAAHAQGIVHRDLKPDNVFLVPDPDMPSGVRTKLLDFGIAKVVEAARSADAATRTRTGSLIGTPAYMSPEQCRGAGEVDHRSDLYSLGCIFYEMVTGRPPFLGDGLGEIIGAHLHTEPTPPGQLAPELSRNAERLALCLLAKRPGDRVQSAAELVRMLGPSSQPAIGADPAATVIARPGQGTMVVATPPPLTVAVGPTTLSGSSGEAASGARPGRSRLRPVALAALLAAAIGGGVLLVRGGGVDSPGPAAPGPVSAAAPEHRPDAGAAATLPAIDAGVPASPPPPPPPVPAMAGGTSGGRSATGPRPSTGSRIPGATHGKNEPPPTRSIDADQVGRGD
ncbi:MAG TPA: protein kinase [Kofleriaceae bacterium]|nr:protein kinase [Kofleriaceae bacterium]